MFIPQTVREQYDQATDDKLKTLIVGAGIAGVSAAQMLRKDGRHPVLIERDPGNTHPGYMLALMPMADAILDDLEVRQEYRSRSVPLNRYGLHDHKGKLVRVDSMTEILDRYGDYRGIARGELLETLTKDGCNVTFDTTVTDMEQSVDTVSLQTDGVINEFKFDLVIIADGIHSTTREFVSGDREINIVDTKWGGWVVWAPEDGNMDLGEELWGAGFFYGVYPVKGRLGVFLGGNSKDTRQGLKQFVSNVRKKLKTMNPRMESCLQAVTRARDPFYWPLNDCRCPQWAFARTILLGDAAAGFLPTAGIGAGMAMESAWVLTRMLRYANKNNIEALLAAYEQAQRPRVEAAQENSRGLAGIMFKQSHLLAFFRDLLMRAISVKMAIRPIQKLVAAKPDPDALARKVTE